jgi:hypothetical protein
MFYEKNFEESFYNWYGIVNLRDVKRGSTNYSFLKALKYLFMIIVFQSKKQLVL